MATTLQPDAALQATGDEVHAALELLRTLPRRAPVDVKILRKAFDIALDGVPGLVLRLAVESILQGTLGHPFMPSPPELRIECDKMLFELKQALLIDGTFPDMPSTEQTIAYLTEPGQNRGLLS